MLYRSVVSNNKLFLPNSKDECGLRGRKTCARGSPDPAYGDSCTSWLLRLRSDSCDICVMRQNRRHWNPQNSHCSRLYGTTIVQLDGRETGKLFVHTTNGSTQGRQGSCKVVEEAHRRAATAKETKQLPGMTDSGSPPARFARNQRRR